MTALELAALKSQLQGTMDCSDMINICYGFKNYNLAKIHMNRMKELINVYNKTNFYFIDKYGEIPYFSVNFEKLVQTNLSVETESGVDWIAKIIISWEKWADAAIKIYEELYTTIPTQNDKWWKYLCKLHKNDLNLAQFFKKKFIPEGYELPQTIKQRLQAKLNSQKQANGETEVN